MRPVEKVDHSSVARACSTTDPEARLLRVVLVPQKLVSQIRIQALRHSLGRAVGSLRSCHASCSP
eukprot:2757696-Alexandrium_andersonii.AAC.1